MSGRFAKVKNLLVFRLFHAFLPLFQLGFPP